MFSAGAGGFILGLLQAQYQWVVEPAQVIAGLVKYPKSNFYYLVVTKSWNLLNQLGALYLSSGLSEKSLSFLLSGLAGMISFSALAVFVFALTRKVAFSFISPFVVFYLHDVFYWGINYPIMLLGTDQTYGMIGLSFFFLIIGLLANQKHGLGFFLLGLMPAVHATQGFWANLVVFSQFYI